MSLNRVCIAGRFTADPELRQTADGVSVANFTLAVDRDFKDKDGNKLTDFIDIVAWRNDANFVSKYFSKGKAATVEGKLQTRNWKDKDGNNRKSVEVVAEHVYFGDSKKSGENTAAPVPSVGDYSEVTGGEDELPF